MRLLNISILQGGLMGKRNLRGNLICSKDPSMQILVMKNSNSIKTKMEIKQQFETYGQRRSFLNLNTDSKILDDSSMRWASS